MQHARQHDVADVLSTAFEKPGIFLASKAVADELHAAVKGSSVPLENLHPRLARYLAEIFEVAPVCSPERLFGYCF